MASDNPQGAVEIKAPGYTRRSRGLLLDVTVPIDESNARPADPGNRTFSFGDKIVGGINFVGQGCATLDTFENAWCEEVTLPSDVSDCDERVFSSFAIVDREQTPARFHEPWVEGRIRTRFGAMTSARVAAELLSGTDTGNPSLSTSTTDVVDELTPVDEALWAVNELAAQLDGVEFTVHASPGLFELLVAAYDISQDEVGAENDPTVRPFRTATGHVLVGDAGHDGTVPPAGFSTDPAGSWLYATIGRPAVYLSDVRPVGEFTARFDRLTNKRDSVMVRDAIVAFDPCMVIAVQVEVPTFALGS